MEVNLTHNIEVAHRLLNLPGKCQQIHGHSMIVTLRIFGEANDDGYMIGIDGEVLDFGTAKRKFRYFLDEWYDHHLLLNENDPWATAGLLLQEQPEGYISSLPGLQKVPGDPSTENIARWILEWAKGPFGESIRVEVRETGTNGVACGDFWMMQ